MPSSCAAVEPESEVDDEADLEPFLHVVASAASLPVPQTRAARSIFELPARPLGHLFGKKAAPPAPRSAPVAAILRADGLTRCTGAQYPDNRWTAEKAEHERARRAKQRPPRPSNKYRTNGEKLKALIRVRWCDDLDAVDD